MKKKMGWSHPDIQLEDFLKLIKGFVDILILASGYQSSGSLAHWDPHNFNKAFQWGLFFQNVLRQLRCSDGYQDSVKELDAALSEITSNPFFPQGLAHLSSDTLHRARDFVLEHLIHTLPLRDTHLRDFTIATIEMDLDELRRTRNDFLNVYLNKLVLQNSSVNPDLDRRGFMEDSIVSSQDIVPNTKIEGDFTEYTIQELIRRQSAVSCISSAEAGLDILCKAIRQGNWNKPDHGLFEELLKHASAPLIEEQLIEYETWNCWKKRTLSYFLDKRTIRLVSGASMIFSAPKVQWVQVFERLNISAEASDDVSRDIIEILSLGCIASRWSSLIEHFMSVSYDSLTIVKQFHEVCSLLSGPQNLHSGMENKNSKEKSILEHLAILLGIQPHQLWKLSPVLAAVAIPSWSPLFRLYLSELEAQFKGDFSPISCCSCLQNRKEHKDCELAERIWCLHIYHVCGSHRICGTNFA
ncbi:hypothetical protein ACSBR2_032179 [Camellia fascicularis]